MPATFSPAHTLLHLPFQTLLFLISIHLSLSLIPTYLFLPLISPSTFISSLSSLSLSLPYYGILLASGRHTSNSSSSPPPFFSFHSSLLVPFPLLSSSSPLPLFHPFSLSFLSLFSSARASGGGVAWSCTWRPRRSHRRRAPLLWLSFDRGKSSSTKCFEFVSPLPLPNLAWWLSRGGCSDP